MDYILNFWRTRIECLKIEKPKSNIITLMIMKEIYIYFWWNYEGYFSWVNLRELLLNILQYLHIMLVKFIV